MEQSRHMGTTRMTARGRVQLSYCAASTRKTRATASEKAYIAVLPVWSWSRASSVQSVRMAVGMLASATDCMASMAWPELTPGAGFSVDRGRGIQVVADDHQRAADVLEAGERCRRGPSRRAALELDALEVVDLLAESAVGLDVDLPGAAEEVEVVDVQRTEVDLEGVEQLRRWRRPWHWAFSRSMSR